MSFRISTNQLFSQNLSSMMRQQQQSIHTQQQLSTGLKIITADDDPLGSVRLLGIERNIDKIQQYQRNANAANMRLNLEEEAIDSSINVVQRVRDLALQGINATNDNKSRLLISQEVKQQISNMLQQANSKDGNGDYIFSGFQGETKPFNQGSGGVSYGGDQGQRLIKISSTLMLEDSDPGDAVFMDVEQGNGKFFTSANVSNTGTGLIDEGVLKDPSVWGQNSYSIQFTSASTYDVLDNTATVISSGTYTEGALINVSGTEVSIKGQPQTGDEFHLDPSRSESIFEAMLKLQNALATPQLNDVDRAAMINTINHTISSFDRGIENLNEYQTSVGIRLNEVDRQKSANETADFNYQGLRSNLRDVDYAEAITRFNRQLLALQAAQQSFTKMQGISLFNYIN